MLASCGAFLLALSTCAVVSFVEWAREGGVGYGEDTELCGVRTPLKRAHYE